ncbi:MAG TPA: hypothetical protein VGK81_06815, partial [Anaerolineae bacterium]
PRIIQPAAEMPRQAIPPHVATGFKQLDAITGCGGVPLSAITLFSGPTTSGKMTLAYKVLANAQESLSRRKRNVAILDLTCTANPDYLARCGVDLEYLLFARAPSPLQAVDAVFDLARGGQSLLLVDGLGDLLRDRATARYFDSALPELKMMLAGLSCAVIFVDEVRPPWLRHLKLDSSAILHSAALHVELRRERWIERERELIGYGALAQVVKTRWGRSGQTAPVEIIFNGTVRARDTW